MKKLDKLLITSFVGPFFVTFLIAIFVLMMQYLWVYVDDIIGKGAGLFMLVELLTYLVVSLIPMALPIAILISSVMVLGNLAEHYELSSMKSAGIPLLRIMRPLMVTAVGISMFSFFCSNSLIPVSNLKFKSRLYDIRKQRPTLSIEESIFNDDFQNYVIRVGKKGSDNETVEDVMMYDHSDANEGRLTEVIAKGGRMYTSKDGKYFIMDLKDGYQYYEIKPDVKDGKRNYPFVRTSFKEWTKVFDLSAFEIQRTDEELFKTHYSMLSAGQLSEAIDSINLDYDKRKENLAGYTRRFFSVTKDDKAEEIPDSAVAKVRQDPRLTMSLPEPAEQYEVENLEDCESILELFVSEKQSELADKGKTLARTVISQVESTMRMLENVKENRVKHVFELHSKFSFAVACFVFLFIGAPMGAIIRKGGFGYPILISIIFFMIFIILTIMCKKLSESYTLEAATAAWMPSLVLFPIGFWLTRKAMNDSKLLNVDRITNFIARVFSKKDKASKPKTK